MRAISRSVGTLLRGGSQILARQVFPQVPIIDSSVCLPAFAAARWTLDLDGSSLSSITATRWRHTRPASSPMDQQRIQRRWMMMTKVVVLNLEAGCWMRRVRALSPLVSGERAFNSVISHTELEMSTLSPPRPRPISSVGSSGGGGISLSAVDAEKADSLSGCWRRTRCD